MGESIGRIIGKTSTSSFKASIEGEIKKWDYIKINHPEIGPVLAQVTELERHNESTIADCNIIGYRTERGFLRQPRTPLEPSSDILTAEDELIINTLGLTKSGLYVGLLEGKPTIKTFIDPEKLLTRHLAVIAKSGVGKSYSVAVILEELMEKGFPVIVIDPHGEYSSIKYENNHPEDIKYFEAYGISPKGYFDNVKEFALNTQINTAAEKLKLSMPSSAFELIQSFPFKLSDAQKGILFSVINEVKERKPRFEFDDLVSYIDLTNSNAKWGLISAIENLQKTGLFSLKPTEIGEILKPNQLTIINLKGAAPELQEVTVASLAMKLFEQRKLGNIPPFFLVIEEAHAFCPERGFGEASSSKILRTLASEGRKFGLGLCVVSQRPARIDKNVLSQCNSQMVFQVTNPNDLKAISSSFEGIRGETENEIKSLPVGKSLVIGAADYPTFVDIRVRKSAHGGRAEQLEFDEEVSSAEKSGDYAFRPRIMKANLMMLEDKEIKNAKLVLYPCLCVYGQKNENNLFLVFDLIKNRILNLGEKLEAIEIPENINKLSPMQKKILFGIASGCKTGAELLLKTGLTFGEVEGILENLKQLKLIEVKERKVSLAENFKDLLNLEKLNFLEKGDYMDLPGEKLEPSIKEENIIDFVSQLDIEVTNKKLGWLPLWQVEFEDGSILTKDAISWNLTF